MHIAMVESQSKPFRLMADRIDLNAEQGFSGAACIVPPGDGRRLDMLLLRNIEDPVAFWSLIRSHADMAIQELANAEQEAKAWGTRR